MESSGLVKKRFKPGLVGLFGGDAALAPDPDEGDEREGEDGSSTTYARRDRLNVWNVLYPLLGERR